MKKFIYITILALIFNGCSIPTSTLDKTQSFILKNDELPLQANFIKSDKILKFKMRPCLYIFIQDQLFMCKKV